MASSSHAEASLVAQPLDTVGASYAPILHATDDDLSVADAAKLLGTSPATILRRVAEGAFPAQRDGRAWRLSKKVVLEVGPARKRAAPRSQEERAHARGELAALVFPLLSAAVPVEDIVIQLAADPAEVMALVGAWDRCRRLTLALAGPAPTPGPTFDHAPSADWNCCPGHLMQRQMRQKEDA